MRSMALALNEGSVKTKRRERTWSGTMFRKYVACEGSLLIKLVMRPLHRRNTPSTRRLLICRRRG